MNDDDLKSEVEELRQELEEERKRRDKKESNDFIEGIIGLGFMVFIGYWLFNGGFGHIARFLFWAGFTQR